MKILIFPFFLAIVALLVAPAAEARLVKSWSEQELLDASDLVVNAAPLDTFDLREHIVLGGQPVIGVETKFEIITVVKGKVTLKTFLLHHFRPAGSMIVPNAPTFVRFDPKEKRAYRLYLKREAGGGYAPVAGQEDPGLSIRDVLTLGSALPDDVHTTCTAKRAGDFEFSRPF